jgi:hypothetical protein
MTEATDPNFQPQQQEQQKQKQQHEKNYTVL